MAERLILAANRLADVLAQENVALRAMNLAGTAALLPEKTAAIAEWLAVGEAAVPSSDPTLTPIARRLDGLTRENRQLLERAIVAQRRVIGIVVRAAASVAETPAYGAKRKRARPPAMALSARA